MNLLRCFVILLASFTLKAGAGEYPAATEPSAHLLSTMPNNSISSVMGFGQANEKVHCDRVVFTLRFNAEGEQNDEALENARTKMSNTREQVKAHGYELVATALTDIKLSRTTYNSKQRMSGYVQYEFVVGEFNDPLLLMSQVIGEEVDQVSNLYYELTESSEAIERLKVKALEEAAKSARVQAKNAGVGLGKIIDVQFHLPKPSRSKHPMRKIQVSVDVMYSVSAQNQQ